MSDFEAVGATDRSQFHDNHKGETQAHEVGLTSPTGSQAELSANLDAWKPGKQERLILLCLCIVCVVVALDATIVVPVLPVSRCNHREDLLLTSC